MDSVKLNLLLVATAGFVALVFGGSQKYDFCSVCRAVVLEADEMIRDVDPKKTIDSGSFRVDPTGNQKITQKQYARSNTHLEEVVESVCSKMHQYADRVSEDGTRQLVRVQGYSDEYNDALKLDHNKGKSMKYQCEQYLEDFEEDVIGYLQEDVSDHEKYICMDKTGVCTGAQLEAKVETVERPKERHAVEVEGEDEAEDNNEESDDDDDEDDENNSEDENDEKDEL